MRYAYSMLKRLPGWWAAIAVLVLVIALVAGQQVAVHVWKVLQVVTGLALAYLADRALFWSSWGIDRQQPRDAVAAARLVARAVVAGAVILAMAVGL